MTSNATKFSDIHQNGIGLSYHSLEIRGLRSTKCSSETLQNLLYFMYKNTHVIQFVQLYFLPYECPGLCLLSIR